ncbi:unnamed protein product (macronuclear) [Paramecium tetraurelia]|uniref:EF-hand domain-containing protein n=1 Tax=Paramecium tetraurelia TaxID=5888 RepID=A0ED14_PARTE|nr:uncharacterized protein GSPATT00004050001 [Paramecium tetraurelia]CAK93181.1 unnamed protein product [Paramecium tetraurelia]|eukprot:XP_001460578.1 hypothetical protein (macronuclear) [Paramecium tetraurelia strain d4-2]
MNFYFFIQYAVEAEAKLEEIRILLASQNNFEPFTTYKRLDQPRTGGLKPENIYEFLLDNEIQVGQDELDYIFRVLDEDSDSLVTYQDFKNAILPKMNDQVKDQALNHKSYDLPVDMQLPKEIETQLSQFFIQIKQNYLQYQQIQEKIDLNQLDIYDNDNQITVDSLKNWLQQQGEDISNEILENFVTIIQGQQQQLQILLDQIYTENQEEQEQQVEENVDQEQQQEDQEQEQALQEDQEQFLQEEELEQVQQKDTDQDENDTQQNNQQEQQSQEIEYKSLDYKKSKNDSYNDIDYQIQQLKNKINKLEVILGQKNTSPIGSLLKNEYNRELLNFSRMSYQRKFNPSSPTQKNDLIRQQLRLDEEIKIEEIKQKILLTQINNSTNVHSSGFYSNRFQNQIFQSPLNQSKSKYISDNSGNKYIGSNRKQYPNFFQKSINFSNRKF